MENNKITNYLNELLNEKIVEYNLVSDWFVVEYESNSGTDFAKEQLKKEPKLCIEIDLLEDILTNIRKISNEEDNFKLINLMKQNNIGTLYV